MTTPEIDIRVDQNMKLGEWRLEKKNQKIDVEIRREARATLRKIYRWVEKEELEILVQSYFRVSDAAIARYKNEIELLKDQLKSERDSSKLCPSCGLLWPHHGDFCGLWVSRENYEAATLRERERAKGPISELKRLRDCVGEIDLEFIEKALAAYTQQE